MQEESNGIRATLEGLDVKDAEQLSTVCWCQSDVSPTRKFLDWIARPSGWTSAALFWWTINDGRTRSQSLPLATWSVKPMLAHKASHEGRVAVEVIAGKPVVFKPYAIPAVVFTDPELAWCGLTETQAASRNQNVAIVKFPWAASGRAAITLDRVDGLTKLVLDPETERVLGVGVVGSGAGELIAEGVLAIEMAATATDVKLSIHPHPTLS